MGSMHFISLFLCTLKDGLSNQHIVECQITKWLKISKYVDCSNIGQLYSYRWKFIDLGMQIKITVKIQNVSGTRFYPDIRWIQRCKCGIYFNSFLTSDCSVQSALHLFHCLNLEFEYIHTIRDGMTSKPVSSSSSTEVQGQSHPAPAR